MTDLHEMHEADYSEVLTDSLNNSKWHLGTDPDSHISAHCLSVNVSVEQESEKYHKLIFFPFKNQSLTTIC